MRKKFLLAAAAAALLSACGIGAQYPQFSQTSYRIEGVTAAAQGGGTVHTVIYRDGPKMRVETTLPDMGEAIVVFDESTDAAYVLNPPGQIATSTAQPEAPGVAAAPAQVDGVALRIEDTEAPQRMETAWAALGAENARSTGRCEVAGERGREWTPRNPPARNVERAACITDDGIVLRVTESGRTLWEATSLQRGQQNAALFGVPAGYQLIDPQRMTAQIGQNQLDSVTGAPPEPQEAPVPRG